MECQHSVSEDLLSAWLRLTTTISNERIVSEMPFNEALICNLLYHEAKKNPEMQLTATDLCERTRMLKSLMNRTLNQMEEKGMIQRRRSTKDKRQVFIALNMQKMDIYLNQHHQILVLINRIVKKFGEEKAMEVYHIFEEISDIAEQVFYD